MTNTIWKRCSRPSNSVYAFTLAVLALMNSFTSAAISISMDDIESPPGEIFASVLVDGDSMFDSIALAVGSNFLEGDPTSRLVIDSFSLFEQSDSVWSSGVLRGAAPQLPAAESVLNVSGADPTGPTGTLFTLAIDASQTSPGDVFELDFDLLSFSQISLMGQSLSGETVYNAGRITIVAPFVLGDFNLDGVLDATDIDLLSAAVREQSADALFDVDGDGEVSKNDRAFWVNDLKRTYFGDANLDGQFDSSDFVQALQFGEYDDELVGNSTWASGDFNGDSEFDSGDLVVAFQVGAYEQGPRPPLALSVPEPTSYLLVELLLLFGLAMRRCFYVETISGKE